jgi:hypothetical protein
MCLDAFSQSQATIFSLILLSKLKCDALISNAASGVILMYHPIRSEFGSLVKFRVANLSPWLTRGLDPLFSICLALALNGNGKAQYAMIYNPDFILLSLLPILWFKCV